MQYFDRDFRKFSFQFVIIIIFSLLVLGAITEYLGSGGEANIIGQ